MGSFWKKSSLRLRLFWSFGILLALLLSVSLSLQSGSQARNRTQHLMQSEIPAQLERLGAEVSLLLSPSLQLSRSLASSSFIEHWIRTGMDDEQLPRIEREMNRVYEQLMTAVSVFIAANDGEQMRYLHLSNGTLNHHRMNPESEQDSWYFRYIRSQATYELNLDLNDYSGDQLIMFVNYSSMQRNAQGQPLSVAGVGIDMRYLADMISDYRLGQNGRASLVNTEGTVEVASDKTILTGLSGSEQLREILDPEGIRVEQLRYAGNDLLIGAIWLEDLQRFLVVEVPMAEFMDPIRQQLYQSLGIGALLGLLGLALLSPLTSTLTQPLREFQRQLHGITDNLDLSQRIVVADQAEIGNLAQETNGLLERLERALQEVSGSSSRLSDSAGRLAWTAGLVSRNSDLQDQVSQSMAAAVEQMSSSVAEITSTMEELSASSTQIADHSQSVVDVAELTLENSRKGVDAMQHLQHRMGDIRDDNQQSLNEIVELGSKSKQISKVMDLINTLADQTKLIAFNAALEASSAGDSGKRFSVVAGEIRRLADSVTDSTREIEERIQEIQDAINRLVITSEKGSSSIEAGIQVSSTTAENLNALLDAATRTSSAAQQISLSTQQQKTASNQVVVALRDISSASSNNAQSVRQITEISEEMIAMSERLNDLVQEFRLARMAPDHEQG